MEKVKGEKIWTNFRLNQDFSVLKGLHGLENLSQYYYYYFSLPLIPALSSSLSLLRYSFYYLSHGYFRDFNNKSEEKRDRMVSYINSSTSLYNILDWRANVKAARRVTNIGEEIRNEEIAELRNQKTMSCDHIISVERGKFLYPFL